MNVKPNKETKDKPHHKKHILKRAEGVQLDLGPMGGCSLVVKWQKKNEKGLKKNSFKTTINNNN